MQQCRQQMLNTHRYHAVPIARLYAIPASALCRDRYTGATNAQHQR